MAWVPQQMLATATLTLDRLRDPAAVARTHGIFNIVGGGWPLVSMRSFELVFGPKTDRWLEYTVGGLLVSNGLVQVAAAESDRASARRLGCATAATLLAIDVIFVSSGRLRPTYLLDAVFEAAWLALWARARSDR